MLKQIKPWLAPAIVIGIVCALVGVLYAQAVQRIDDAEKTLKNVPSKEIVDRHETKIDKLNDVKVDNETLKEFLKLRDNDIEKQKKEVESKLVELKIELEKMKQSSVNKDDFKESLKLQKELLETIKKNMESK